MSANYIIVDLVTTGKISFFKAKYLEARAVKWRWIEPSALNDKNGDLSNNLDTKNEIYRVQFDKLSNTSA